MTITRRVRLEVARVLARRPRVIVAVSGGLDSMTLLDAVAHAAPERVSTVAVFDHRSGPAARRAVVRVRAAAAGLGLPVRVGRAPRGLAAREAAWRDARWQFLRALSREHDAIVMTAHTRDDQLETVFLRALRDSGARGLAALHAGAGVVRPLLAFTRAEVESYARQRSLEWVEDPSNASLAYARNRARLELLPALQRAQPGFGRSLLALSERAWTLRQDIDRWIDSSVPHAIGHGPGTSPGATGVLLQVARSALAPYDADQLRILWPALASRVGVALDRRGTERLATFTITGRQAARIQLSGGLEAMRVGDAMVVRRAALLSALDGSPELAPGLSLGSWRFRLVGRAPNAENAEPDDLWSAFLPVGGERVVVRSWRPGDRMLAHGAHVERRLKGLFRDAGVDAARRRAWPVVLVDDRIVWVPGVRRSSAATVRSGGPVALYRCERDDS